MREEPRTAIDLPTMHALAAQSEQEPVLLADGRRVWIQAIFEETAVLCPLLNPHSAHREGPRFDPDVFYEVDWEVVQRVLARSEKVFYPDDMHKSNGYPGEQHVFGLRAGGQIWRFARVVGDAEFLRLTAESLPHGWVAWHQGTTPGWLDRLASYPVVTSALWQALLDGSEEVGQHGCSAAAQDPIPLLEQFVAAKKAAKELRVHPCTIAEANGFVGQFHSHSDPVVGAQMALCVADQAGVIHGVALMGRPVARMFDSGKGGEMKRKMVEVLRVATDRTPNVCSMLYAACRRVAKDEGYERIITYLLESEQGAALKADGWTCKATIRGRQWTTRSRPRAEKAVYRVNKTRWECLLNPPRAFGAMQFHPSSHPYLR